MNQIKNADIAIKTTIYTIISVYKIAQMDFILINRIGLVYNANWGVKSNYLIVKK